MFIREFLRNVAVGLVLALAASAVAAAETPTALANELQGRLDLAYGPIWASGDAARFVKEFLTDDTVLTASDGPTVWNGKTRNIEAIKDLMKSLRAIKATGVYAKPLGPNAAFQFVKFDLTTRDPAQQKSMAVAKSLYVWIKTKDGWRVAADHYSFATMETPH